MKLFNFFKKKTKIENEKINKEDLPDWIKNKKSTINEDKQKFLNIMTRKVDDLVSDLKGKLSILEDVNLDGKKEQERIKSIVKENHRNYMIHVHKLIDQLESINKERDVVEELNLIFANFQKKSAISHAKATYLIGKEIGDIQEAIGDFFRGIRVIIKENKSILDKSKAFDSIEKKINEFNYANNLILEIKKEDKENDDRIEDLKSELKDKERELEVLENSEFVQEINRKKQEIEQKKQNIDNTTRELGRIIDFKELTHICHSSQKSMNIIREYKDNFLSTFHKSGGEDLFVLLKDTNLYNDDITNKVKTIVKEKNQSKNIVIENSGVEAIEQGIGIIKNRIDSLLKEKATKEKRLEKSINAQNEINEEIREKLDNINVTLE